jgi:hypothetical protein
MADGQVFSPRLCHAAAFPLHLPPQAGFRHPYLIFFRGFPGDRKENGFIEKRGFLEDFVNCKEKPLTDWGGYCMIVGRKECKAI